jgi:hypothetical protein
MVRALAQLEQSLVADAPVPTGGRAIHAYPLRLQLVHPDQALVERGLKALPLLRLGQRIQHQRQPVIAPPAVLHLLASTHPQRLRSMSDPALHLIHPMIPFRQDVGQPDHGRPAQAHALPVAMRLEVAIQQVCDAHPLALGQQERNIVYSFGRDRQRFCHSDSLPYFQNLVTI